MDNDVWVPYILQYLATTQQAKLGLSPADTFYEGHTYAGVIQCGRSTTMMIYQNALWDEIMIGSL